MGVWRRFQDRRKGRGGEIHVAVINLFALRVQVMMSMHNACMFGAIASVHAWERVGAALCFIARRFLRIAACRYVDDFFAAER